MAALRRGASKEALGRLISFVFMKPIVAQTHSHGKSTQTMDLSTESTDTNELPGRFFREEREAMGYSLRTGAAIVGKHHSLLALEETNERKVQLDQVCRYPWGPSAMRRWAESLQPAVAHVDPACRKRATHTMKVTHAASMRHVEALDDGDLDDGEAVEVRELKRQAYITAHQDFVAFDLLIERRKASKMSGLKKAKPSNAAAREAV